MGKSLDLQPRAQKGSDQGNCPTPEQLRIDHLFNQPSIHNRATPHTLSWVRRILESNGKALWSVAWLGELTFPVSSGNELQLSQGRRNAQSHRSFLKLSY